MLVDIIVFSELIRSNIFDELFGLVGGDVATGENVDNFFKLHLFRLFAVL
jgi:hypothetical protein